MSRLSYAGMCALSILAILCGFGFHAIVMATNLVQGWSFGIDEQSRWIFGAGAVAIDAGVGLCSLFGGLLWRMKLYVRAGVAVAAACACGGMSLLMFYMYSATIRVEPSRIAHQQFQNQLTAKTKSESATAIARTEIFSTMQDQIERTGEAALNKKQSKDVRDEAQKHQANLLGTLGTLADIEVKPDPVEKIHDAGAAAAGALVGWSDTQVQEAQSTGIGALLLAVGSMLIGFGPHIWPEKTAPDTRKRLGAPTTDREQNVRDLSLRLVASNDVRYVPGEKQVCQFFAEMTEPSSEDTQAKDMHPAYVKWAKNLRYSPVMSFHGFQVIVGKAVKSGALNLPTMTHVGNRIVYSGISLRSERRRRFA